MTVLEESVEVSRPISEVYDYVADFTTTAEWDATAQRATKLTPGAIREGTQFEVVCALPVGSITIEYTVVRLERNKVFELAGRSRLFDISDTITFSETQKGTRIDYRAEFAFKAVVKPFVGLSQRGLEKMGRESVAGLGKALDGGYSVAGSGKPERHGAGLGNVARFTSWGYRRGLRHFNPMSASVRDKHVVITGANAGLGFETARELARRGASLTLVMRDPDKAEATVERLRAETGNEDIVYELADLSLLADVDKVVASLRKRGRPIDVLVNNAGALFNPRRETDEGLEQSFALLLASPWRLTLGLKPLLAKAGNARVVNVVSGGMYTQPLKVDALLGDQGPYSGSVAYARQKRALMVVTEEWAQEWAQDGITVNAMHPGWADTPGVRGALPQFHRITRRVLRSPEEGADTIVWLAVAEEADDVSGKLFLDREVQPTHLLRSTRERDGERSKLMELLAGYAPDKRRRKAA